MSGEVLPLVHLIIGHRAQPTTTLQHEAPKRWSANVCHDGAANTNIVATIAPEPEPLTIEPVIKEILLEFEGMEEFPAHNPATVSEFVLD